MVCSIISLLLLFSLIIMLLFQIYLIYKGLTSNEYLKETFVKVQNPFDDGFKNNLKKIFKPQNNQSDVELNYLVEKKLFEINLKKEKIKYQSIKGVNVELMSEINVD